jgi:protein-tyrosine phosphatase
MIIHMIKPGLFQSSEFSKKDYKTLKDLHISAVIDHAGEHDELMDLVKEDDYLFWPFFDHPYLPDLGQLKTTAEWGYRKWKSGKALLVHCAAGRNRSGLTNGMILVMDGMTGKDAVKLIQAKIPGALCNKTFREYLEGQEAR